MLGLRSDEGVHFHNKLFFHISRHNNTIFVKLPKFERNLHFLRQPEPQTRSMPLQKNMTINLNGWIMQNSSNILRYNHVFIPNASLPALQKWDPLRLYEKLHYHKWCTIGRVLTWLGFLEYLMGRCH